ncbi:MAG: Ldh family oxidoreductase [Chloroflexi bacterium]|nr:Ldh family oxidoreductase [Chloroflexota bacterium]MBU1747018.1 Ldh family oxidoreductase [Chloroflexota bacterium]MBU1880311.1 Ldh family oxidoreductase [Chloroflexota bacterium]
MSTEHVIVSADGLRAYVARFMRRFDVHEQDAAIAADVLVAADLRGVESHGVIRLHSYYGSRLKQGHINPRAPLTVLHETPATLALDGGNGLGQPIAHRAMTRCIEKAQEVGAAFVTVRNSNHFGIAGYYAMMALPHRMIGLSLTNSQPLVVPTYGRRAMVGTNPIAIAAPTRHKRPFVLDMATSVVPIGKVTVYQKQGLPIPLGWAVNADGVPTTDPNEVVGGRGAVLPLGGTAEFRGYKGYGLGVMVDILCGVLSGAAFGPHVGRSHEGQTANIGHFFAAIRVDALGDADEFAANMDAMISDLQESPKATGEDRIYVAGEKEYELAEYREEHGIPLHPTTVEMLQQVGQQVGVPFDLA